MNLLIIGDPHAHPDYDNSRFEKLGKFIVKAEPDAVICMGDFADMPSLSTYDKGTKGFEGRRYKKDVDSILDAQDKLFAPIKKFNENKRKRKVGGLLQRGENFQNTSLVVYSKV